MSEFLDNAHRQALQVLQQCLSPMGMMASALEEDGYPQVWARDALISYLAAPYLRHEERLLQGFRQTLELLAEFQSPLGMIPTCVVVKTRTPSMYGGGSIDSNEWFIIGLYHYYRITGEVEFLQQLKQNWQQALTWLFYQDVNGCGLVEHPEGATWMDLMSVRHNSLYANVLYYAALKSSAAIARVLDMAEKGSEYERHAEEVKRKINLLFWVWPDRDPKEVEQEFAEWGTVYRMMQSSFLGKKYYLPFISFRHWGDYCDTLGNCLAILYGVAPKERAELMLPYMQAVGMNQPYPARALYPPVYPGEPEWREYYRTFGMNMPFLYHNGGIWPMVGGFYVYALAKTGHQQEARQELEGLARANQQGRQGEWEFNEWLHGQSGLPMGAPRQAWSAAMFINAYGMVMEEGKEEVFALE